MLSSLLVKKVVKQRRLWRSLRQFPVGITLDVITYTAVISACGKGGKAEKALEIFNKMLDAGITPNVITYNAVISACEKGGKSREGFGDLSYFHLM